MVKRQDDLEKNASLVISQQQQQQPEQQPEPKQKQQQQQQQPEQQNHHHHHHHLHYQHQDQDQYHNSSNSVQTERIDIDLTPTNSQGVNYNYAQKANALYAPLNAFGLPAPRSYEQVLPPHRLHLQHALLASTPYTLNTVPPEDIDAVAVAVSGVPLAIMPNEIPAEDEERLERIFNQLDRDGDGKIDIHDLSAALHEFGLSSVYAEVSYREREHR